MSIVKGGCLCCSAWTFFLPFLPVCDTRLHKNELATVRCYTNDSCCHCVIHCLSSSPAISLHKNCWTNSFQKEMYCHFVVVTKDISNKKVSMKTLEHRYYVGTFCKNGMGTPGCTVGRAAWQKSFPGPYPCLAPWHLPTATSGCRLTLVILGKKA